MTSVAVIPAAGLGTRLGLDVPKILAPLTADQTAWSVLRSRLLGCVDHIHVVLSEDGYPLFQRALAADPERDRITTSVQKRPIGMGDAIFGCRSYWEHADTLLTIWSDQVHVSEHTIKNALELHGGSATRVVIPLVPLDEPYVEFKFNSSGALTDVLQSREGELCSPGGLGDLGTFVLSVGDLGQRWRSYLKRASKGSLTNEVNFLPFLVALSAQKWEILAMSVSDPIEALGINTPDDLANSRSAFAS